MKPFFGFLLICLFLWSDSFATGNTDSLDNYLRQLLATQAIPGFSTTILKNGSVIFSKGYGKEKQAGAKPFTTRTLSAVGSLTKSITALAVLHLAEEGRLSLDTPLVRYIPWFHTLNRDRSDKITPRMLLNNTSGLVMHNALPVTNDQNKAQELLLKNMSTLFLNREPGTSYEYSNAGFCAAGVLITAITGMGYSTFIADSILRPIGMNHSSTDPLVIKNLPVIPGHYFGLHRMYAGESDLAEESNAWLPAGASLFSSAEDMGKYLAFLCRKSSTLLSRNGFDQLWQTAISFPGLSRDDGGDGSPFGYGMGWMIARIEERTCYFHAGSTGKMSACMVIDSASGTAAAFLANIDLTFIDKYHYTSILTIANNLLRIARGLPASNYGVQRTADPFLNSYALSAGMHKRYTGTYTLASGDVYYLFRGSHLEITSSAEGLKALLLRRGQVLQEYLLDFISPVSGITRNIAIPQHFHFSLGPDGDLEALQVGDIRFIKKDEEQNPQYRKIVNSSGTFSILIPHAFSLVTDPGKITAVSPDGKMRLSISDSSAIEPVPDQFFKPVSGKNTDAFNGKILEETIGENTWKEQSRIKSFSGEKRSILHLRSQIQGRYYFVSFECDTALLTKKLQSDFRAILNSFTVL